MKELAATISWDVSGYYLYLPAAFIYKDLKQVKFKDTVLKDYNPQPGFAQAFKHEESGNYVMKYSIGQAVVYSPFFAVAHIWASSSGKYPADGFSFPYQFMISMGMLLWTIIGLLFLKKSLSVYFEDKIVALGLLGIVLGSNYLNYAAIDGAMTHNTVFTIYAVLLYLSIRFHQRPAWSSAIGIGVCVGLASLIRPTEIISCLIPIFWGLTTFNKEQLNERFQFLKKQFPKLVLAVVVTALIGFIQLGYWKYATGDWIVYSYQDQGFSWLKPHLINGLFSYKSGWLTYSPFMIFSLPGFIYLYKLKKGVFIPSLIFSVLFIYIAFAWDIWWYGGSLGQRTMVQCYPVLAFPLCAFILWVSESKGYLIKSIIGLFAALFIYANVWFTHQCHYGGLLKVGRMTKAYFWATLFTFEKKNEDLKLLDTAKAIYEGDPKNIRTVYHQPDFKQVLTTKKIYSTKEVIPSSVFQEPYDWIRLSADFYFEYKEWDLWHMTQFIVEVKNGEKKLDSQMIRVQNLASKQELTNVYFDIQKPEVPFTSIDVIYWNGGSKKEIDISNFKVEVFED